MPEIFILALFKIRRLIGASAIPLRLFRNVRNDVVCASERNVIFLNKKISNVSKDRIVVCSKNFHAVIVECYVVQCPNK